MKFEVIDLSGKWDAGWLAAYCAAQQRQLREHYAIAHDGDGDGDEVSTTRANFTPDIVARIEPNAPKDQEGALGYHEVGLIHAFDDLARSTNTIMSTILSHEVLESRRDRRLHKVIELDDGTIIDCEICDRVESDAYMIDGVPMSNFNTPSCFEPLGVPGEIFDWMKLSTKANECRPGGYWQLYVPGTGWQQKGQMRPYRAHLFGCDVGRVARRAMRGIIAP